MKEINLHGMELTEALIEIHYALKECKNEGFNVIEIIHGYHSGTVLKTYIQSPKFLKEMKKDGFMLKRIRSSNQGATRFQIS